MSKIKFIKNIKPNFDLSLFDFKINKLKLDNKVHPENRAIKELDRVASTQNKVWDEDIPKEIREYINNFGFVEDDYHVNMNIQYPGQMAPLHTDEYIYAANKFNVTPDKLIRYWISLTDWEVGQVFGIEEECFTQWKAGDCYTFDSNKNHLSVNAGQVIRYTLLISLLKVWNKDGK